MDGLQELPFPVEGADVTLDTNDLGGSSPPNQTTEALTPPRSRAKRQKKETRSLEGVEKLLVSIHFMLATATGLEDLNIDQSEAHLLADALATLADHYKIKLDGKTGALMGLIYALGAIYGPRAVTISLKRSSRPKGEHHG